MVLFPAFSNSEQIDAVRSAYDPLATKIPPHITLVFPFDSPLSTGQLAKHAVRAVESSGSFLISLGKPQVKHDLIWLPVEQGGLQIVALHSLLYRGPLACHLDSSRLYEPHVTVARPPQNDSRVRSAVMSLQGPFEAVVDELVIERIMPDDRSSIETVVKLGKNS